MLRLTLRSARAHWRRFVLTAVAVVVGVAFVVGSFVLTDSLAGSIRSLLKDTAGRSDYVVRPAGGSSGGPGGVFGGSRAGVPVAVARSLADVPGVAAADGVVSGPAQLLDKGGDTGAFDFTLVSNWPGNPDLFGVSLASGRAPSGPDDVVVDTTTAGDRGISLGDTVRVATRRGVITATVSGLADQQGTGLVAAAPVLAFTEERAADLVGVPGWFGVVNIRLEPGADPEAVVAGLQQAGGPDVSVLSSEALLARAQADIEEELTTFVGLLLGFAAVTLFVSAFLIWNTFTIVVAQRTRELALLRAVGASRRQVSASVVGEGVVVGVVASVLGLGMGVLLAIGLRSLIGGLGVELPDDGIVMEPRTVVAGLAVGIGVTLVSVLGPARRATTVPPVAAIAAVDATPTRRTLGRPVLGSIALVAGLVIGARALLDPSVPVEARVRTVALGALVVFLGVAGVARFLSGPIIGVIAGPFRRFGGVATRIAGQNAVRNPRRTASTASALHDRPGPGGHHAGGGGVRPDRHPGWPHPLRERGRGGRLRFDRAHRHRRGGRHPPHRRRGLGPAAVLRPVRHRGGTGSRRHRHGRPPRADPAGRSRDRGGPAAHRGPRHRRGPTLGGGQGRATGPGHHAPRR